jgi:hypothetical protein
MFDKRPRFFAGRIFGAGALYPVPVALTILFLSSFVPYLLPIFSAFIIPTAAFVVIGALPAVPINMNVFLGAFAALVAALAAALLATFLRLFAVVPGTIMPFVNIVPVNELILMKGKIFASFTAEMPQLFHQPCRQFLYVPSCHFLRRHGSAHGVLDDPSKERCRAGDFSE